MLGSAESAPIFSGTIPDVSETENTGLHQYALGAYFSFADSYSISPAVEAGWSFDTVSGELEIDTDAVGLFGPYVVTATNAFGTDDSNAFSVTVVAQVQEKPAGRKRRRLRNDDEEVIEIIMQWMANHRRLH